jgi:putative ABC transport system ATP-binding protein
VGRVSGSDGAPLIELRGVTRIYGSGAAEVRALDGIDLRVDPGEFVAVMGPSGSGKSTCMNIIGFLDSPSSGRQYFEGVDVHDLSRDQRALLRRHYLGFVFQGFNLLHRTSALENVELPLVYRRLDAAERRALALDALSRVGLAGRELSPPGELSGGQQQRVAIARAIVTRPKLLLADEPTGNLDSARSAEIMALLTEFNADGITIIVVTHDANVAAYARRRIRFLDGRIVADEAQPNIRVVAR